MSVKVYTKLATKYSVTTILQGLANPYLVYPRDETPCQVCPPVLVRGARTGLGVRGWPKLAQCGLCLAQQATVIVDFTL